MQGFCDHIDHAWMLRMLAERIDDRALRRLSKKWLKAGVLDTDGQSLPRTRSGVLHPVTGTPQGSIRSPPCGVPFSGYVMLSPSRTPACRHCPMRRSMLPSLTRFRMMSRTRPWSSLSKHPLTSASTIQPMFRSLHCSRTSCSAWCGLWPSRKPWELS